MFVRHEIEDAVDLLGRSYALLQWLETAIERGFISFDTAHDYASFPTLARLWLERHYLDIPNAARPPREQLQPFANLFASFMESSFDMVRNPGKRLYSDEAHCFCPMCSWLVAIPRIRPKRLTREHKRRARRMKLAWLHEIAFELDRELSDQLAEALVDGAELGRQIGMATYGVDLLRRIEGKISGPASLALWRSFAWTAQGSPIRGFMLDADAIIEAEQSVARHLCEVTPNECAG